MDIKTIPKLDLHCHLDGSLTKAMMERHLGKTIPEDTLTVSEDCTSLTEYLEKFDLPVQCLQDEAGLEDGAYTFVEEIAKEHVEYIEVRFAPMLSVHENLSCAKVIESVRKGMERAKADFQVQYGIIVCAMRNHSQEQNLSMLKCAREYLGHGVCALDLAGDESAFPTSEFRDIFVEAKRLGMPFTIHSGETGNLENVREANWPRHCTSKRSGADESVRKCRNRSGDVSDQQLSDEGCIRMEGLSAAPVCGCWNKGQYQHGQPNGQRYDHDKRTDESLRTVWAG